MPREGAHHAGTPVHHIELVRCLSLGSSVQEEVAHRESFNASSSPYRCGSFGALHFTFSMLRPSHPLPQQKSRPIVLRFRLRVLHPRSLKPHCVRNRNQPTVATRHEHGGLKPHALISTQLNSTQLHSTQLNSTHGHTARAHERSASRVPRTQWITDSHVQVRCFAVGSRARPFESSCPPESSLVPAWLLAVRARVRWLCSSPASHDNGNGGCFSEGLVERVFLFLSAYCRCRVHFPMRGFSFQSRVWSTSWLLSSWRRTRESHEPSSS